MSKLMMFVCLICTTLASAQPSTYFDEASRSFASAQRLHVVDIEKQEMTDGSCVLSTSKDFIKTSRMSLAYVVDPVVGTYVALKYLYSGELEYSNLQFTDSTSGVRAWGEGNWNYELRRSGGSEPYWIFYARHLDLISFYCWYPVVQ